MANDDFARGLFPLNWPKIKTHFYRVGTGTDVFFGELVDFASTGYVTNAIAVNSAGTQYALGVAVGFAGPDKSGLATDDPYLDASDLTTLASGLPTGDRWVEVADDPEQEFVVQGDTGGTLMGLAAVGETAVLIYRATSGNVNSGWANLELDASSNGTGTGALVVVQRLHEVMNSDGTKNTAGANYAKWVVRILHHRHRGIADSSLPI